MGRIHYVAVAGLALCASIVTAQKADDNAISDLAGLEEPITDDLVGLEEPIIDDLVGLEDPITDDLVGLEEAETDVLVDEPGANDETSLVGDESQVEAPVLTKKPGGMASSFLKGVQANAEVNDLTVPTSEPQEEVVEQPEGLADEEALITTPEEAVVQKVRQLNAQEYDGEDLDEQFTAASADDGVLDAEMIDDMVYDDLLANEDILGQLGLAGSGLLSGAQQAYDLPQLEQLGQIDQAAIQSGLSDLNQAAISGAGAGQAGSTATQPLTGSTSSNQSYDDKVAARKAAIEERKSIRKAAAEERKAAYHERKAEIAASRQESIAEHRAAAQARHDAVQDYRAAAHARRVETRAKLHAVGTRR